MITLFRPDLLRIPRYARATVLMLALLVSGCASLGGGTDGADDVQLAPRHQLTDELMYEILAAEFAGNRGDLKTSVDYYKRAAVNTDDPTVAARATYIALFAGQYQDVIQTLQRWELLTEEREEINRVYAVTYLKLGDSANTAEYLHKQLVVSAADDRDKALAVKNLLAKESDNHQLSLDVLTELNLLEQDNLHLHLLEARYAAQLEDYDGAIRQLDKIIAIDPKIPDVYIIKSKILGAQGRQAESMAIIESILQQQPDNHELRMNYARLLVDERRFKDATAQFLLLLEQQPDNPDTLLSLALLSIETEQYSESQAYLEKLIALDKRVDVANYYLGRIAQNDGKAKIAIAYYLKVTNGDYVFDAKLRIAGLFASLGRPEEGLRQLEALAEKQTAWPNRVRSYLAQGEILRDEGRHEEAVEMYSRALLQNPDDPDLLYARALAAEKVDRLDITEADLLRVLSAEPENANALNALGYTLADRTSRLQEAAEYIKRAAELVPDDPAILDSLGWVSYRLGKMQEALRYLRAAFEKLDDAEIAAHYGEVLWVNEQYEEARRVWAIGKESDADHPVLVETIQRLTQ